MHCCISRCTNTSKKYSESNGVKFYYFPKNSIHMPWLCEKRQKWINAVKNHTKHSNDWLPSKNTTICSAHFIGNKKSENPTHPSYVPTIFPGEENKPQNQASAGSQVYRNVLEELEQRKRTSSEGQILQNGFEDLEKRNKILCEIKIENITLDEEVRSSRNVIEERNNITEIKTENVTSDEESQSQNVLDERKNITEIKIENVTPAKSQESQNVTGELEQTNRKSDIKMENAVLMEELPRPSTSQNIYSTPDSFNFNISVDNSQKCQLQEESESPREKELRSKLARSMTALALKTKVIKRLRECNRRQNKKICRLTALLNDMKKKLLSKEGAADMIQSINIKVEAIEEEEEDLCSD